MTCWPKCRKKYSMLSFSYHNLMIFIDGELERNKQRQHRKQESMGNRCEMRVSHVGSQLAGWVAGLFWSLWDQSPLLLFRELRSLDILFP